MANTEAETEETEGSTYMLFVEAPGSPKSRRKNIKTEEKRKLNPGFYTDKEAWLLRPVNVEDRRRQIDHKQVEGTCG